MGAIGTGVRTSTSKKLSSPSKMEGQCFTLTLSEQYRMALAESVAKLYASCVAEPELAHHHTLLGSIQGTILLWNADLAYAVVLVRPPHTRNWPSLSIADPFAKRRRHADLPAELSDADCAEGAGNVRLAREKLWAEILAEGAGVVPVRLSYEDRGGKLGPVLASVAPYVVGDEGEEESGEFGTMIAWLVRQLSAGSAETLCVDLLRGVIVASSAEARPPAATARAKGKALRTRDDGDDEDPLAVIRHHTHPDLEKYFAGCRQKARDRLSALHQS